MATKQTKIKNWNMSRGLLNNGFDMKTEVRLLEEEFDELQFKDNTKNLAKWLKHYNTTEEERLDALCDIIVVATGAIYKLGYDADKALDETIKEINSRIGSINKKTGKFEKDLSEEAKKRWYKARYHKCKL